VAAQALCFQETWAEPPGKLYLRLWRKKTRTERVEEKFFFFFYFFIYFFFSFYFFYRQSFEFRDPGGPCPIEELIEVRPDGSGAPEKRVTPPASSIRPGGRDVNDVRDYTEVFFFFFCCFCCTSRKPRRALYTRDAGDRSRGSGEKEAHEHEGERTGGWCSQEDARRRSSKGRRVVFFFFFFLFLKTDKFQPSGRVPMRLRMLFAGPRFDRVVLGNGAD